MNIRRFATNRLPIVLYCLVGVGLLVQGVRYLVTSQIAYYHIDVLATPWDDVAPNYQQLLLGLYRGFGAGFFCVSLATILLALIPLRHGQRWAMWATPAVAGTYTALLAWVTSTALLPGANPIAITSTMFCIVVIAAVLSCFRVDVDPAGL
ncbi:MAG: hypothetical protein ACR2PS_19070 [Pseudomonadales bacterium]